jgi:hypothetical protein
LLLKYLFLGCLAVVGVFAFSKRDYVLDAFDWGDPEPGISVPAFDAVARAQELHRPPPEIGALRVVEAADTRGALLPVLGGGDAPPPPALQGGSATVSGTVSGPGGAVAGATVRIERFLGESVGSVDLQTDANGGFALRGAPGGRYRVRAWLPPTMAQLGSQVAFLTEGEQRAFALQLTAPSGSEVDPDWSSAGWMIGSKPVISVTVLRPYVTSEGRVELGGQSGLPVTLTVGGALVGSAAATTDGGGAASFEVTCAAVGPATANLRVGSWAQDLTVPVCAPLPTTTTTTTTTTTVPGQPPPPAAPPSSEAPPPAPPAPGN